MKMERCNILVADIYKYIICRHRYKYCSAYTTVYPICTHFNGACYFHYRLCLRGSVVAQIIEENIIAAEEKNNY